MIEQIPFVKGKGRSRFTIIDDRLQYEINTKNSYLLGTRLFP